MKPEVLIASCALVISLISIGLTLWQIIIQRIHNYKSIKPIGQITVGDYEENIFVGIENNGIGPLTISNIKIGNGKRFSTNLMEVLPENLTRSIIWTDFTNELEGRTISPGETVYLIQAIFDEETNTEKLEKFRTSLRKALQEITIEFHYVDIYERNKYFAKRQLSWFGRTLS